MAKSRNKASKAEPAPATGGEPPAAPAAEAAPPVETAPAAPAAEAARAPAPPSPVDDAIAALGLVVEPEDGLVALQMLTGMGGPDISLVSGDTYRCPPEQAVRLVRACFARQQN